MAHRIVALAALVGGLAGCDGIVGVGREASRLGVISFYQDPIVIEVPATVERGRDFVVAVRTYGGGCIRQGPTESSVDGLQARVTPYDIDSGADVCTDELRIFRHETTLRFDRTGTAVVLFQGRSEPDDRTITEQRTIAVN